MDATHDVAVVGAGLAAGVAAARAGARVVVVDGHRPEAGLGPTTGAATRGRPPGWRLPAGPSST